MVPVSTTSDALSTYQVDPNEAKLAVPPGAIAILVPRGMVAPLAQSEGRVHAPACASHMPFCAAVVCLAR